MVCRGMWHKHDEVYLLTCTTAISPSTYTTSSPSVQRDSTQRSLPCHHLPLLNKRSPATSPYPATCGITDEYRTPLSHHITEVKPVSVLFGHRETNDVKKLVLTKLSNVETTPNVPCIMTPFRYLNPCSDLLR